MDCVVCGKKATHNIPKWLCLRHWCEWFNRPLLQDLPEEEVKRITENDIRRIRYNERKSKRKKT
jgi:hypothetical protein